MTTIVFISPSGDRHAVDAGPAQTVMDAAVQNGVAGIDADCGGACACATCHVHVDPVWRAACGMPSSMEQSMLDFAQGADDHSRLSCQIRLSQALDGLVVRIADEQG